MEIRFNVSGVKFGILHIKDITVKKEYEKLKEENLVFNEIKNKYTLENLSEDKIVTSFRNLYWSFNMDPTKDRISSEALVRRILKGENMWNINNIVDNLNLVSAKYRLPMGYVDVKTVKGDIIVRQAKKDEVFVKIGGQEKKCKGTEICVADDNKIIDFGFATSDSDITKITENTKELLILIYGTSEVSDEYMKKAMDESKEMLKKLTKYSIVEEKILVSNVKKTEQVKEQAAEQPKADIKKQTTGLTVKKDEDFSEWYTQVIQKSDMADYSSVSGCIVYKPYSYEVWEKIQAFFNEKIKKSGVKNAYFPLLIPESLLTKEQTHVQGFAPEVAWVTHGGNTKLNERLAVRPTSETIMYDSYSKWIRSHNDLPLRINQWNSVVRWEFKHATPFLRGREFLWQEGHTVFAKKEEAEAEVLEILDYYAAIYEELLAVPVIKGRKTETEKFAGADYSTTCETWLPVKKAIQGCTSHHLGQTFAKAFDISFLDKDGKKEYGYQNSWGFTTRSLGVMIIMHGDDKGLVLPPNIAPTQAVIVPIIFDATKEKVLSKAKELKQELKKYSVFVDDREGYTPGWKFNEWELKGVPVRIELGPRDLENDQVVIVRRDTGIKETVKLTDVKKKIDFLMKDIQKNLYNKAKQQMDESTVRVKTKEEFLKAVEEKKWVLAPFCGDAKLEEQIKEETGYKTNCIPFKQPKKLGKCFWCSSEAKFEVLFGKSF